jgi:hypothetical protein
VRRRQAAYELTAGGVAGLIDCPTSHCRVVT